jgi:type II secretory pathway pseudopilin PulG
MNQPQPRCDTAHTGPEVFGGVSARGAAGYTLVEILVAFLIFVIFMVGMLNLLDTSTRVSEVEKAIADTQENVRFAAYHIMRTARMIGGGDMPFAVSTAGGDNWVSGVLASNQSGAYPILGHGNVDVAEGSDVLTLRGFFEVSPFFVLPQDYNKSGSGTYDIHEQNPLNEVVNDFNSFTDTGLKGRGVVFMGEGLYCVGKVGLVNLVTGTAPDRRLILTHEAGDTLWPTLNSDLASYPPGFRVHRVGILDSYTFFVDPQHRLMRLRVSGGTVTPQPVAVNIGALQIALGIDTNNDGLIDTWNNNPTGPDVVAGRRVIGMRVTVLGRTPFSVSDWQEPVATFQVEDANANDYDRTAKWRRIEVSATLRNFLI